MADDKREAEEQDELGLEKEKLADLDLPEEESKDVKGGLLGKGADA
jgi:hypothetical protein